MQFANQRARNLILIAKDRAGAHEMYAAHIFDDFIHVVDTLRFLRRRVTRTDVTGQVGTASWHHVVLSLGGDGLARWASWNRMSAQRGRLESAVGATIIAS